MIRIAIADTDKEYVRRLVDVLETYGDVNLSVYTDVNNLEAAFSGRKPDVLLFGVEFGDKVGSLDKSVLAIMLLDDEKPVPMSCFDYIKVHKYQRVSTMYQQVIGQYSEWRGAGTAGDVLGQNSASVILFYSPSGGVGKTTVSLASAVRLAEDGKNVLYLNLEDIAAEDFYLPQNMSKGISELLGVLGSNVDLKMKLQSLLQNKSEHLYYLNHFTNPSDFDEMTADELEELLDSIERCELFDVIIVDMGVAVPEKRKVLFEAASKIVIVERPDAIAAGKLARFMEQRHIVDEYDYKMVRVLNFASKNVMPDKYDIPRIGSVSFIPNSDAGQLIDILANNYVAQLVGGLLSGR